MNLSIIIPTFNTKDLTLACLESIKRHTLQTRISYEIIVVDNGSVDGTGEALGMPYLALGENKGFAAACNRGTARARGDALCFLNSDTEVTEGWAEGLTAALGETIPVVPNEQCYCRRKVAAVGPMSNNVMGKQYDAEARYNNEAGLTIHARWRREKFGGTLWPTNVLSGFCLCVSQEAWERVGPFDERFFPGNFDDNDWCRRATDAGYALAVAPGVYIHHHGQQTFVRNKIDYRAAMRDNRKRYEEKWANEVA